MSFRILSNAKINLRLRILRRRPDGFHELETWMLPVDLSDEIEFSAGRGLQLSCDLPDLPLDERNLAMKAAVLLRDRTGVKKGAKIRLFKKIPLGAGLGGGSSNGTYVLRGLNRLWKLELSDDRLEEMAAELGSDTAFFVRNKPAIATGRGEKLRPLALSEPLPLVLFKFDFGSATGWAYQHCGKREAGSGQRETADVPPSLSAQNASSFLVNDLEPPVFRKFPILGLAKEFAAGRRGVRGVMMSGSGSTLFALTESDAASVSLADALHSRFPGIWTHVGRALPGC
ncbi:MAG: 4-(cytidine 5'-diphospho)-2-C-methyl-D-erythritol kinase [Verrucomicrobiae bacterium]|nr:4-(cytidine 5'-diphospho)-2-C-methyl-D-erythritol kinase [Verrucomicrobiae bacterium]